MFYCFDLIRTLLTSGCIREFSQEVFWDNILLLCTNLIYGYIWICRLWKQSSLKSLSIIDYKCAKVDWIITLLISDDGSPPGFFTKAGLGMLAGASGAFVGTPAEVALVRMTADGRLPLDQRRNYSSVFNALVRITREEGLLVLWRGTIPTIGRAMVVNAAQLASYSQAKEALISTGYFKEDILLHFCSSMISGLITTAASMPVDIAKTR